MLNIHFTSDPENPLNLWLMRVALVGFIVLVLSVAAYFCDLIANGV